MTLTEAKSAGQVPRHDRSNRRVDQLDCLKIEPFMAHHIGTMPTTRNTRVIDNLSAAVAFNVLLSLSASQKHRDSIQCVAAFGRR